ECACELLSEGSETCVSSAGAGEKVSEKALDLLRKASGPPRRTLGRAGRPRSIPGYTARPEVAAWFESSRSDGAAPRAARAPSPRGSRARRRARPLRPQPDRRRP